MPKFVAVEASHVGKGVASSSSRLRCLRRGSLPAFVELLLWSAVGESRSPTWESLLSILSSGGSSWLISTRLVGRILVKVDTIRFEHSDNVDKLLTSELA